MNVDESWDERGGGKKSEKDSQRRPPNAFLIFANELRPQIQKEYPDKSSIELTGILSKRWGSIDDSEKSRYREKASELLREFKQKNPQYNYRKARKKKMISHLTGVLSENPLLGAQLASGQFGSDVFEYPLDPEVFFFFAIGNRYLERALR